MMFSELENLPDLRADTVGQGSSTSDEWEGQRGGGLKEEVTGVAQYDREGERQSLPAWSACSSLLHFVQTASGAGLTVVPLEYDPRDNVQDNFCHRQKGTNRTLWSGLPQS